MDIFENDEISVVENVENRETKVFYNESRFA